MANRLTVSSEQSAPLWQLAQLLPKPALTGGEVSSTVRQDYARMLSGLCHLCDLKDRLVRDLGTEDASAGYVILEAIPPEHAARPEALVLATALCSLVGIPFRVIDAGGLWQELGVDVKASPNRFRGIGHNPLHIDIVNSTQPPSYTALFCVRTDPAGGGHTLVSNLQRAVGRLSSGAISHLESRSFSEGRFYGMSGVGVELNPFPVLERAGRHPPWIVRFTAKMIPGMKEGPAKDALGAFERALVEAQESFLLRPGHLLILNQRIVAHGRLPLGPGQHQLTQDQARYLRQTYLHAF